MSRIYQRTKSSRPGRRLALLVAAFLFLMMPLMAAALFQYHSISGDIRISNDDGPEIKYQFSPNGNSVVFVAPADLSRALIYSVPAYGGSQPILLVEQNHSVGELRISPDSHSLVFNDREPAFKSVPLAGGPAVKLWDSGVVGFQISADSQYVVFSDRRKDDTDFFDLYSVPIAGGAAWQLNEAGGKSVNEFAISPNSRTVVYSTMGDGGQAGLFSVPVTGGALQDLTAGLGVAAGYGIDFHITADGTAVVFGTHVRDEGVSLFTVPVNGGQPRRLAGPFAGEQWIPWFEPTSDGRSVLYVIWDPPGSANIMTLHTVPAQGGAATKLAEAQFLLPVRHTDDTIAYRADNNHVVVDYLVQRSDYAAQRVGGPFACPVFTLPVCERWQFEFTPDGRYLLSTAVVNNEMRLYSTVAAGGPTRLLATVPEERTNLTFQVAGDSSRVYYIGATAAGNPETLFAVSSDGVPPEPVVPAPAEFLGWPPYFQTSPTGNKVLFAARWSDQEWAMLYVASPYVDMPYANHIPLIAGGR